MNAKPSNPNLFDKIIIFNIDLVDSTLPISKRLSRDNAWSQDYAQRVLLEYKKFCYLAAISRTPLTPSDQVDQAWHLHLLYTRQYWGDWCNALGLQLHHGPTKGGEKESNRYRENYQNTLSLYEEEFGKMPPKDIWPDIEERFRNPARYKRIDTNNYLFFKRKPTFAFASIVAAFCLVFLFINDAFAHSNIDPTLTQFLSHSLRQHTGLFLIGVVFGCLILNSIYQMFLKPEWAKEDKNTKRESSDDGSGAGHTGCSGCGGCS